MGKLNIEEEFRYRLEKALTLRNMKPIDLVRATGISESAISQYRKGLTEPKRDRLVLIANALSVNASWLMGLDVPMEEPIGADKIVFSPTNEEITIIEKYRLLPKDDKEQVINTLNRLFRYAQMVKEIQPKEGDDSEKTQ